ncbi:hypothetical protein PFISCL1PPCAC_2877 [Pristionchus fissidentatus]|uniref:Uncharacterized protein n=1 Tax=Pristionchus fissidentatus TaxID=1538716 RepID=A0AAV5V191_9BILA|nr:hypothetical protein PFISCL1PPCAC_2877 [Pristionchus fissidentatus]
MSAEERRLELERKKQKLAEMRQAKKRQEDERRRLLLNAGSQTNGTEPPRTTGRQTFTSNDLEDILLECGVAPTPNLNSSPSRPDNVVENGALSPRGGQLVSAGGARLISLELTSPQTVTNAPRDNANYSKMTQTDDEKVGSIGDCEFSTGSQEFDYDDDDMMGGHVGRHHLDSHVDGSPIDGDLQDILRHHQLGFRTGAAVAAHDDQLKEEEKPQKLPDLSEEEKNQIMCSSGFLNFFEYSSKVMFRALAEDDIFINYAIDSAAEVAVSGERLTPNRSFLDEKWTAGRAVVGISFSEMHPELVAVAYDELPEASGEPNGVVVVWNTKFKKPLPEYVFYCYSRLTSVAFARFHPHLIIGGCYSGQLVLWDNRLGSNKKTPCNKSPLSVSAHTHPVYSLAVVGSSNAHNIVSVSTDGKLCAWNMETLAQPVEGKELIGKPAKPVAVLCMAFPPNDVNSLVVAGEDGGAYFISRHGSSSAEKMFEGHSAPVSGASFHPSIGPIDFSHIFLTSSMDWTIKLWSLKDPKLRMSLEAHVDYVYDVAWSPTHPAVFASIDTEGNLFLWNLNEDVEGPVTRLRLTRGGVGGTEEVVDGSAGVTAPLVLRKLSWSSNGHHLLVGGADGEVRLLDVHECMHTNVRSEEWGKFACMLADVRQTVEEAEELSESVGGVSFGALATSTPTTGGGSLSTTPRSSFATLPGQSTAAALVAGSSSPRSLGF